MTPARALPALCAILLVGCGEATVIPRWEPAGGPQAQNITAFLVDEKRPSCYFAGTSTGDVFTSSDQGATWFRLYGFSGTPAVNQLTQDPEDGARLYAATEEGVFVSTDGGRGWSPLPLEAGSGRQPACRVLTIDPWNTSVLFAGTRGRGMARSTDRGKSWIPLGAGPDARFTLGDVSDIRIDFTHPDVVFAAVAGIGVVRSTDTGMHWTVVTEPVSARGASPTRLVLHRSGAGLTVYGTSSGSLFRSSSGGATWTQTRQGLEDDRILSLAAHPANHDLLFAGTEAGIFRSSDFGASWERFGGALPHVPTTVVIQPDPAVPSLFVFGAGIGLQVSTDDGTSWRHIDRGLGGAAVPIVVANRSATTLYAATGGMVLRHDPRLDVWETAGAGLHGGAVVSICLDPDTSTTLYASTPGGLFRTTDGGTAWELFARTLPTPPTFIDTHPWFKTRLIASCERGIYYSTNRGASWNQAMPHTESYILRSITYTPTNAGFMFGATTNSGVVFTSNGGVSWGPARFGMDAADVLLVTLDDEDPQICYAWTTDGRCFRSVNRGLEWNRYATPWPSGSHVLVAADRATPSSVVALVDGCDVYYSLSGGGTWIPLLLRGPQLRALSVHWNRETASLHVGTSDRGVLRLGLAELFRSRFGE